MTQDNPNIVIVKVTRKKPDVVVAHLAERHFTEPEPIISINGSSTDMQQNPLSRRVDGALQKGVKYH